MLTGSIFLPFWSKNLPKTMRTLESAGMAAVGLAVDKGAVGQGDRMGGVTMAVLHDPVIDDPLAHLRDGVGRVGGSPQKSQEGGTTQILGGIVQICHIHIGGHAHVGIGVALEKFIVAPPGKSLQIDDFH